MAPTLSTSTGPSEVNQMKDCGEVMDAYISKGEDPESAQGLHQEELYATPPPV